jgi:hypothetical protein
MNMGASSKSGVGRQASVDMTKQYNITRLIHIDGKQPPSKWIGPVGPVFATAPAAIDALKGSSWYTTTLTLQMNAALDGVSVQALRESFLLTALTGAKPAYKEMKLVLDKDVTIVMWVRKLRNDEKKTPLARIASRYTGYQNGIYVGQCICQTQSTTQYVYDIILEVYCNGARLYDKDNRDRKLELTHMSRFMEHTPFIVTNGQQIELTHDLHQSVNTQVKRTFQDKHFYALLMF